MSGTNSAIRVPKIAGDTRQLLFLALCSLALVVAAFAAPPTAQGSSPPDVPFPDLFGNQSQAPGECVVTLSEDPVPGREVTVNVHRGGDPVEGVRVWFDDRSVGVTNQSGQVDAQVPYVRELEVTVGLPGGGSCEFVTGTTPREPDRPATDVGDAATADARQAGVLGASAAPESGRQSAAQAAASENVSDDYAVYSSMNVGVNGTPNPGETVDVVATIGGDPVPGATVSVDGEDVGRTDQAGRYSLAIPDDGTERLTVRVQRGEIRGQTRIHVRLLRASVSGDGLFPLPGQSGTVRAAIGTDAAAGADVLIDGERVGTTDERGTAAITLPADPTATVTVTSGDRTTRTWAVTAFAPTIVAVVGVLVVVVGIPLATYWAGGRRAVLGLVGIAVNLVVGAAGYAVAGRDGALFAVGSAVLLGLLILFVRRPGLASTAGDSTGRLLDSGVDRFTGVVLWFTRGLEVLLDQVAESARNVVAQLRGFDPAALAAGIWAWSAGLPGRVLAGLRSLVTAPRRLYEWLRSGSEPDEEGAPVEPGATPSASAPEPAIRELWRSFARRVVPDRWPQRTPGEVSRRAIDDGFPRESVAELTAVFRDVEYGGTSLSTDRFRRARAAFETLDDAGDDSRGDGDDASADDGRASGPRDGSGDESGDGEVT